MVNVFEVRKFVVWSGLLAGTLALIAVAALSSHKLAAGFLLAVLPFLVFAGLTLLEANDQQAKRQMRQRNVLRVSRSVYERLDPEVLQLFLSERDFTSTDYERLMQLEAFNEKKSDGATEAEIHRLPLTAITEPMLRAAKNPSCSICLVHFELQEQVRLMPCFHHFHPPCIDTWLKEKAQCPASDRTRPDPTKSRKKQWQTMGYPGAATSLNTEKLRKLLRHAKVTQQSIQTVSTWILDRRAFLDEIVDLWVQLLREGDAAHQIVYLYIANDTMQVGVRKYGKHISEVFESRLLEVVEFVMTQCDEKVKRCMIKIIGIWKERHTITPLLLEQLENVCAGKPAVVKKPVSDVLNVDDQVRVMKEALLKEISSTECEDSVLADMTDVIESEATAVTNQRLQDVVSATISADLLSDRMFQLESSLSTFHHAVEAFSTGENTHDETKTEEEKEDTENEKSAGNIVWTMLDQPVFEVDVERSRDHVHQYRANLETQNAKREDLVNHLASLKLLDPFQEPMFHTSEVLRSQQRDSLERLYTVCLQAELLEKQQELERQAAYGSRPPMAPTTSRSYDAMRVAVVPPPHHQSSFSSHNDYYRSSEPVNSFPQASPPRDLGHRRYSSMDGRDFHTHGHGDDHRYGGGDGNNGYNKRPKLQHSQSLEETRHNHSRPSRWDQSPRGPDRSMPAFQDHSPRFGYGDRVQGNHHHNSFDRSPRHNQPSSRSSRWDDGPRDQPPARHW